MPQFLKKEIFRLFTFLLVVILGIILAEGLIYLSRLLSTDTPTPNVPKLKPRSYKVVKKEGYDIYKREKTAGYVGYIDIDIYYKGKPLEEGFHEVEDYCYDDTPGKPLPKGNKLREYLIMKVDIKGEEEIRDLLVSQDRRCECVEGACIKPTPVDRCIETDSGRDIFVKGKVTGIQEGEDFISEGEDYCKENGSAVMEGFCYDKRSYAYSSILCEGGCEDGRCLEGPPKFLPENWPIDKCYDSDHGENYYVKGETYGNYKGDVFDKFIVGRDWCATENQLNEYYCPNATESSAVGVGCPCFDGVCIKK